MSSNVYNSETFRLFRNRPSFVDGVSALLDISDTANRYHINNTPKEADLNAIHSDWLAVGQDMVHAIENYVEESK